MLTERRSCVRHKVNGPVFASFDGVTGGMILDLSEQGLSMQTIVPLDRDRRLHLRLDLPDSEGQLETTGTSLGQTHWAVPVCAFPNCPRRHASGWITGWPSTIKPQPQGPEAYRGSSARAQPGRQLRKLVQHAIHQPGGRGRLGEG